MKRLMTLLLTFAVLSMTARAGVDVDVQQARDLAARLDQRLSDKVEFVKIKPSHGTDVFSLAGKDGKVIIGGNQALSMAVGLNHYLKRYCCTTVSWYADVVVELPDVLPDVPASKQTVEARVKQRFFLNYCTYGYTMPFWQWLHWERFIDWMALNGINMPLAITGQECVWRKVWTQLGMTDDEVRAYFTGPVYLPWHRMANIDGWCGPLPEHWLDTQEALQKQILARERALNMRPVLPAFAGHVPARIAELYPQSDIKKLECWAGFKPDYQTHFLYSEDPLFERIQRLYLEEQTRLFGTDHIYGTDPFNEMAPPSLEPDYLHKVSQHIYESMAAVDPKAEWLQMAWMFWNERRYWTPERVDAMVNGAPRGKMTLLDYFCETKELWREHKSFYGQPFIWCYLGNFGGNTSIQGNVKECGERLEATLRDAGKNLVGIGSTLEALDVQQFPYEYILDKAWNYGTTDEQWVNELADRHSGNADPNMRQAWQSLFNDVYTFTARNFNNVLYDFFPEVDKEDRHTDIPFDNVALYSAWKSLLAQPRVTRDAAVIDLVIVGRDVLGILFKVVKQDFDRKARDKDLAAMQADAELMAEIMRDADALNAHHPYCTLGKWIALARDYGDTPTLKDYYEMNARRIITTWGGGLNDYANRSWQGLIGQYYARRWQLYIDEAISAVTEGRDVDDQACRRLTQDYQLDWAEGQERFEIPVTYDVLGFARRLQAKYQDLFDRVMVAGQKP